MKPQDVVDLVQVHICFASQFRILDFRHLLYVDGAVHRLTEQVAAYSALQRLLGAANVHEAVPVPDPINQEPLHPHLTHLKPANCARPALPSGHLQGMCIGTLLRVNGFAASC